MISTREPVRVFFRDKDIGFVRQRRSGRWTGYNPYAVAGRRFAERAQAEHWVRMTYAIMGWFL